MVGDPKNRNAQRTAMKRSTDLQPLKSWACDVCRLLLVRHCDIRDGDGIDLHLCQSGPNRVAGMRRQRLVALVSDLIDLAAKHQTRTFPCRGGAVGHADHRMLAAAHAVANPPRHVGCAARLPQNIKPTRATKHTALRIGQLLLRTRVDTVTPEATAGAMLHILAVGCDFRDARLRFDPCLIFLSPAR